MPSKHHDVAEDGGDTQGEGKHDKRAEERNQRPPRGILSGRHDPIGPHRPRAGERKSDGESAEVEANDRLALDVTWSEPKKGPRHETRDRHQDQQSRDHRCTLTLRVTRGRLARDLPPKKWTRRHGTNLSYASGVW